MTAWTNIPDSMIQQGKPIRATDGRALRDNPAAIAEGADGAPRVQGIALGGVYLGSFTQDGKNPEALVGLDKVGLLVADVMSLSTGGATVQIGLSTDNGVSYGSWINLYSEPGAVSGSVAGGPCIGKLYLDFTTGAWRVRLMATNGAVTTASGTLSLSGVNAFRLTKSSDYKKTVYDFFVLGARS
ncbi:hypothetical protein SDC9_25149 [bioreactor metagenome]|uniref:Uncharacterized protein n=1 Tax=bioreactor metagenome TaxID=1076179 RepID=A0A644UKG4_9ZZZZ